MIDRRSRRGGEPLVTREHIVEPLFEQHRDRLAQPVEQVGRRRVGKEALRVRLQHFLPIEIGARHPVGSRGGARLLRDRVEAEAGRQHETLLRATDADVDLPFVMPVVDRPERGDGVDHQQRGMSGPVDRGADVADTAGGAGRGLVVDDHHRLDRVRGILLRAWPRSAAGSAPRRQSPAMKSTSMPQAAPPSAATGSRSGRSPPSGPCRPAKAY